MTRNMRIYGFTFLAGLMGSGCYDPDDPNGGGADGSDGGDDDDDDDAGDDDDDDDDDGGSTGGDSGVDAGDDDTSGGTTTTPPPPGDCVPGIPVTSQIPRMRNAQYDAVIRDLLGMADVNGVAPSQVAPLADDFQGDMTLVAWNGYKISAERIAEAAMGGTARANFISCDPATAGCLDETIRTFGRKAFRRPLTEEEVTSFLRLTNEVDPVGTPEEHAEAILYAFLVSPSFLLIPELEAGESENGAFKLSSYEVAARLSFFLWGSIPDDTLNLAADGGALQTSAQILEQAERMLQVREKSGPMVAALNRSYAVAPSPHWAQGGNRADPLFTPEVNTVMMRELDAFFEEITFGGGSFGDLFLSEVAYVNNATAAIYGLDPASYGPELTKVNLDPIERPGFLTRIGFLSSFAHETSTSPALRGAFISQHIIGATIAPPPPGAPDAVPPEADYQTEREYVNALTDTEDCRGCHVAVINPPGYVLENYSMVGAWQDIDPRGGPIDATADVSFPGGIKTITSAHELMQELASNPGTVAKYVEEVVEFATGRAPNGNDQCLVDELGLKLSEGYTLLDMLVDLTQTESFRLRAASN